MDMPNDQNGWIVGLSKDTWRNCCLILKNDSRLSYILLTIVEPYTVKIRSNIF